jgi:hypothetical protein
MNFHSMGSVETFYSNLRQADTPQRAPRSLRRWGTRYSAGATTELLSRLTAV